MPWLQGEQSQLPITRSSFVSTFASDVIPATEQTMSLKVKHNELKIN